jgi:hypothetical protein
MDDAATRINRTVQQDDLAGVPGHGLVLEREDAQILGTEGRAW